ncbi:MAG: SUMF1/EgtB/PvdO family nonheme iron enzyme [Thermoanaerobaculia bacterium]
MTTRILAVVATTLLAVLLPGTAAESGEIRTDSALADLVLSDGLTREQMAGLYRALTLAQFQPPACVAGQEMFDDVPASNPFCRWIEELARRGITGGCTATTYCPNSPVTRAQMAVFVVRTMEACPTLDPTDEMIRVGGVCIDKYEASIWNAPVGGTQITGSLGCAANGQNCNNIYARSVAGVQPRVSITWFQAQAALANSGKRLPTNAEWQMAVRGTPDPGNSPGPEACNTNSSGPEETGERANCVSRWGAHDMVGNLWEWVADWLPASTGCVDWSSFSDDWMCLSGASTTVSGPGALIRGGLWESGTGAGPFAVGGLNRPSASFSFVGFRGAR